MLKHNLGAKTSLRFESTGLTCQIICPLNERTLASDGTHSPPTKEHQSSIKRAYQSSSGDAWDLVYDDATALTTVRHTPNAASGGLASELPLEDFFEIEPYSPQHRAVATLVGADADANPLMENTPQARGYVHDPKEAGGPYIAVALAPDGPPTVTLHGSYEEAERELAKKLADLKQTSLSHRLRGV